MITKVTITGADNSIDPVELVKLWKEFPFVEWGILYSKKQLGNNRFPSSNWLIDLHSNWIMSDQSLPLSIHLCGQVVREVLTGNLQILHDDLGIMAWEMFKRVQINTHGQAHSFFFKEVYDLIKNNPQKEFIFQYDNTPTNVLFTDLAKSDVGPQVSALFDLSHGAGVLPDSWPQPLDHKCGYAGGLGPHNLEEQILLIDSIVGHKPIWLDMETHVRSSDDLAFDLDKVRTCLTIASKYINP